jgi:hypothetical protein
LDFDKVQTAMDELATTEKGRDALAYLDKSLGEFQSKIDTDLNFVESRYVIERLVANRTADDTAEPEVAGFSFDQFQQVAYPTPTRTYQPEMMVRQPAFNRVVPGGFVIKTKPA